MVLLSSWADSFSNCASICGKGRFAHDSGKYVAGKEVAVVSENGKIGGRNSSIGCENHANVELTCSAKGSIDCCGIHPNHISVAELESVCLLKRLQAIGS